MRHSLRSQAKTVRNVLHRRSRPRSPIPRQQLIFQHHQQCDLTGHRIIPLRRLRTTPQRVVPFTLRLTKLRRSRWVRDRQINTLPRQHHHALRISTVRTRVLLISVPRRATHDRFSFLFMYISNTRAPHATRRSRGALDVVEGRINPPITARLLLLTVTSICSRWFFSAPRRPYRCRSGGVYPRPFGKDLLPGFPVPGSQVFPSVCADPVDHALFVEHHACFEFASVLCGLHLPEHV